MIAFDDALIFRKASTRTSCVDIMTRKGNDGQVGNSSTRATGYILCVEKTGSEFVLPISSPGLPKKWQMIGQVACVTSVRGCGPIDRNRWTVFVWLSIGHCLADTSRYQLTNFIDWYRLIDWISDHRFPSIGYPGTPGCATCKRSRIMLLQTWH